MAKKKHFFIMLLLTFLALPLFSQEENKYQSGLITSIEIIGLKRTKQHVAKYPLEKYLGQERVNVSENDVIAAVKDMSVIEPILTEFIETEDGFTLRVTVEEKWSLFPVPLFFAGSGETIYGLFLYDANAFGVMDSIAIGGMYNSNGWSVIAMYNHTPNRQGLPGWVGFFMYGKQKEENVDNKERILRVYTADRLSFSLGLNYSISELITSSARLSFTNISLENKNAFNPPEEEAMLIGINPRISVRYSSWDGFFLSEEKITFEYSYNYAIIGSSYHQIEYLGNYEKSLIPGFRLNIRSGGVWKSTDDPLFEDGPSAAQVNILPRNYSALYYAGLSAGLEKYIAKLRWGTLSFQGAWQCVFSGKDNNDFYFDHGPSGGIVFYLSRIAIPAIGTNIAYNITSGLFQFSFSVGMSF